MDYFLGSVKIMLIVYALAAVISLFVAWVIKGIFVAIRFKKTNGEARSMATSGTGPAGRA